MISTETPGEDAEAARPSRTLEVRYGGEGRKRDAAAGAALSAALAFTGLLALRDRVDVTTSAVLLTWAGIYGVLLLFRGTTSWRRRVVLDEAGVAGLAWNAVEEVFYLDGGGVEVRGQGRRVSISRDHVPAGAAREWIRDRCRDRIVGELRARVREGSPAHFRGVGRKAAAHLGYFAVLLLLSGLSVALVLLVARPPHMRFLADEKNLISVLVLLAYVVLGVCVLWDLRRKAAWHAGWVCVEEGGLVIHPLDGEKRVVWDRIEGVEWAEDNLVLRVRSRRPILLPKSLGNVFALQSLIDDRLGR